MQGQGQGAKGRGARGQGRARASMAKARATRAKARTRTRARTRTPRGSPGRAHEGGLPKEELGQSLCAERPSHEKEGRCGGNDNAVVGRSAVNLLVDIQRASVAPIMLQVSDEEPMIDRERFVFALTKRKVTNVAGASLMFCLRMMRRVHRESEGAALAPAYLSACPMQGH